MTSLVKTIYCIPCHSINIYVTQSIFIRCPFQGVAVIMDKNKSFGHLQQFKQLSGPNLNIGRCLESFCNLFTVIIDSNSYNGKFGLSVPLNYFMFVSVKFVSPSRLIGVAYSTRPDNSSTALCNDTLFRCDT